MAVVDFFFFFLFLSNQRLPSLGIAESLLDTGAFFSSDPRTALVGDLKSARIGSSSVATMWDMSQTVAFGMQHAGNTPLFQKPFWLLKLYAGTGSPVAGPDSFYTHDNSGTSESDVSKVGPWKRIAYSGSRVVKESLSLAEPFESEGEIVTGADISETTKEGFELAANSPLPNTTNAVRFALGEISKQNNVKFLVIEVRVHNITLFEQELRSRRARELPCVVGSVVASHEQSGAADTNAWKNRKEIYASCDALLDLVNPLAQIETAKWTVTALPVAARCASDRTAEVYLATKGTAPVVYEWSDGPVGKANHRKNLLPGKYRVIATDATGLSNYEDIDVKSEVPPMKPYVRIRANANGRASVRVYVDSNSRGPYICRWKRMKTRQCNFTDEECLGEDVVHITDREGCTESAVLSKQSVVRPLVAHIKAFVFDAECSGSKTIANLTVAAREGLPPYVYTWSHVNATSQSNHLVLTNVVEGGLFSFNITDALGAVVIGEFLISPSLEVTWVKGFREKEEKFYCFFLFFKKS
jgi:hypothetical protein